MAASRRLVRATLTLTACFGAAAGLDRDEFEARFAELERRYAARIDALEAKVALLRGQQNVEVGATGGGGPAEARRQLQSSGAAHGSITYDGTTIQFTRPVNVSALTAGNIEGKVKNTEVSAFSAKLSAAYTVSTGGDVVIFDLITTNIGSDYDSSTGAYTAPVTGLYEFFGAVESVSQGGCAFVDQDDFQYASAYTTESGTTMTAAEIVQLTAGNTIRLKSHSATDIAHGSSFFSGRLITAL